MPVLRGHGSKIRVPPDLMPDDETALQYFDMFFTHVHPYIPVLSKTLFYRQWNNDRQSMSPLILEVIFALGGSILDEPVQGQQWLAMATSKLCYFASLLEIFVLTLARCSARRCVHGHASNQHTTGTAFDTKGPGGGTQAWLLLSFMDVCGAVCADG